VCHVLGEVGNDTVVFTSLMALDTGMEDSPVPFHHLQFPVHLAYAIPSTSLKVKHCSMLAQSQFTCVLSHGQLYVALSHCIHPRNIKVLFAHNPDHPANTRVTNVI
jgi:hypothetical protein